MKLNKLKIKDYGCIKDKQLEFDRGISIIKGDNESGKSTTHQALLALLFGFKDASAKRSKKFELQKKIRPFEGGLPQLEGECFDSQGIFNVSRYFDDEEPISEIERQGRVIKSSNMPMEMLSKISRQTFEGIYSLDVDQIARLKNRWQQEQSNILGGLYPDFLMSYSDIMGNLDDKIKTSWKAINKTKLSKDIDNKISEYKKELNNSIQEQRKLRDLEQELNNINSSLVELKVKISDNDKKSDVLKAKIKMFEELLNAKNLLMNSSNTDKYNDVIPENVDDWFKRKEEELKEEKEKVNDFEYQSNKLKDVIDLYHENHRKVYMCSVDINSAENKATKLSILQAQLDREKEMKDSLYRDVEAKSKRLFTKDFTMDKIDFVKNIDIASTLSAHEYLEKISKQKAENTGKLLDVSKIKTTNLITMIVAASIVFGQVMLFLPVIQSAFVKAVGGLISIGALLYLIFRRPRNGALQLLTKEKDKLNEDYQVAHNRLKELLNFGYIPVEKRNDPDIALINAIGDIKDFLEKQNTANESVKGVINEMSQLEREIKIVSKRILGESKSYQSDIMEMRNKLEMAKKLEREATNAKIKQKNVLEQFEASTKKINECLDDVDEMIKNLNEITGSTRKEKIENLKEMRQNKREGVSRLKAVNEQYSSIADIKTTINEDLPTAKIEFERELDDVVEGLVEFKESQNELTHRKGEIESDIKHSMGNSKSPAYIEGLISDLQAEKNERILKRDTYVLATAIIRKSLEKFTMEYKPEFLVKAGQYLDTVTEGKYNSVKLNEKGDSIIVAGRDARSYDFTDIEQVISRGTKEQIYLSLRLAMLDRFDPDGEKLPIILDEALVNWDAKRFSKLLNVISEIAKERQVFIFTCHDFITDIAFKQDVLFKEVLI